MGAGLNEKSPTDRLVIFLLCSYYMGTTKALNASVLIQLVFPLTG